MSELLQHRGPDDDGSYFDKAHRVAIGHRRLAIIDLTQESHQPMSDAATGVVLSYNGELYNFRTLRSELVALGHKFRSQGDTEVVLRAYLHWGTGCFERFAGMFAMAIWDPRSATLHLARDAMGMKPLYYVADTAGFWFASELKALRCVPGFEARLDSLAVQQFIEFGYVFDEERTMLQGARKLPPGHRLEVCGGKVTRHVAWFEPPAPQPGDTRGEQERVDELADLLRTVTREHLIADVPVALLLSGGIDSSLVAALAAREGPLDTITMAFARSGIDEREPAAQVSRFIGSRHTEVIITPEELRAEVERGAWVFDDLFADWGTLSTRLLYRRCRERGVKVVLVGEGADEIFGGYDAFQRPVRGLWNQFKLYQRYAGRRHGRLFGEFRAVMRDALARADGDEFHAIRLFESRSQLPNQYVMKVDKASMAESVEARAPYLDVRVARLAYGAPREWLLRGGTNKFLLRRFAERDALLPPTVATRPKFGASVAASWMDDDPGFRRFARERVLDRGAATIALGLQRPMREYFDHGRAGAPFPAALSIFNHVAWRLLLLELWSEHYLR